MLKVLHGETFMVLSGRVDNLFGWRKPEYMDKKKKKKTSSYLSVTAFGS